VSAGADSVSGTVGAAATVIANPLATTKAMVKGAANAVLHPVASAKGAINGVKNTVKTCAKDKATCAGKIAFTAAAAIATAGAASGATGGMNIAKEGVKTLVKTGVETAKKVVQAVLDPVNAVKTYVKGKVDDAVAYVANGINTAKQVVSKVKDGVIAVKDKVTGGITKASDAVNDKLGRLNSEQRAIKQGMVAEGKIQASDKVCFTKRDGLFLHRRGSCSVQVPKNADAGSQCLSKRSDGVDIHKRCEVAFHHLQQKVPEGPAVEIMRQKQEVEEKQRIDQMREQYRQQLRAEAAEAEARHGARQEAENIANAWQPPANDDMDFGFD
jgi:hypothetical protein